MWRDGARCGEMWRDVAERLWGALGSYGGAMGEIRRDLDLASSPDVYLTITSLPQLFGIGRPSL